LHPFRLIWAIVHNGVVRICSLLPAATEILFALGLGDDVVAVTHECDEPHEARSRPRVTTSILDPGLMASREIDATVTAALSSGGAAYHLDMDLLRRTGPEVIVTQELCAVCAVDGAEVRRAAAQLDPPPRILSIEPSRLSDIFAAIRAVAEEAGASRRGEELVAELELRLMSVRTRLVGVRHPSVLCLEWLDPAWIAGHWIPEVVDAAGGWDVLGRTGDPSRRVTWKEIARADPEVVILMPCGFDVERTLQEIDVLHSVPEVAQMRAFRSDDVYAVDGSRYFNRPGPRIAEGVELLAAILHPTRGDARLPARAVKRVPWPTARPPRRGAV
jgi:iron complex transport system substrate-binding protein